MRSTALIAILFVGVCHAQTTTNCWQYSPQGITCNSTGIPAIPPPSLPFYAPQFKNPDFLESAQRGQQMAYDAALAKQRTEAARQDAEIRALQAQVLRNQLAAQEAEAKRDHSERLGRFRRSFVRLTQCIAKQSVEECSKHAAENDPDFIGARDDAKSGVLSAAEIKAIAMEVQNSPP